MFPLRLVFHFDVAHPERVQRWFGALAVQASGHCIPWWSIGFGVVERFDRASKAEPSVLARPFGARAGEASGESISGLAESGRELVDGKPERATAVRRC